MLLSVDWIHGYVKVSLQFYSNLAVTANTTTSNCDRTLKRSYSHKYFEFKNSSNMSSYQSPSKTTSFADRTAMSHTEFDNTYYRFGPASLDDNRKLMALGALMQHGLGRCVIRKPVWDAHLASQQNTNEDGNESSDIDIPDFYLDPWVAEDLLVTGKDILLWAPLAKGGNGSRAAARARAKIKMNAHGGFCGLTKSWKIPFGLDPELFAEGKAYAERKGMVALDTPRIYLKKVDWRGDRNITIKNNFKKLGGSFDWLRLLWYLPGGAHLNGLEAYFSLFADQANVPSSRPVPPAAAPAAPLPPFQAAASNVTAAVTKTLSYPTASNTTTANTPAAQEPASPKQRQSKRTARSKGSSSQKKAKK